MSGKPQAGLPPLNGGTILGFLAGWAATCGVDVKEIHIRSMKTKWASCSSRGRLTFDRALLRRPKKERNRIIVHELLHLRYPNHGKMFKILLRAYTADAE